MAMHDETRSLGIRGGVLTLLGLCAGSALGQATAPPGAFNVAHKAIIAAPGIAGGEAERLLDADTSTAWLTPLANPVTSTTATVLWTNAADFPIARVDLKQNNDTHRFRQVVVTVTNTAGDVVFTATYNNTSVPQWNSFGTGNTLQVPVSATGSTIRLDFSGVDAGVTSFAGFQDMWVWTTRPGCLDPLGAPVWSRAAQSQWIGPIHEPQVRDDEVVLFRNGATQDTLSVITQSPEPSDLWRWDMRARGNTPGTTVVAAAAGRALGDAAEQVAVVRRASDNTFRVDLMDLSNGRNTVLGSYPFTPANPDSDVDVVIGELDDATHPELPHPNVFNGRRCSDVAICYEAIGSDNMRRMRIELLSWANLSREDIANNVTRAPIVLAQKTLNSNQNGFNVGKLLHQDGTPNRMRLRWGRFPNAGYLIAAHGMSGTSNASLQVAMLSAYTMRTSPNAAPKASGVFLRAQGTRSDWNLDHNDPGQSAFQDTWEIAVGRYARENDLGTAQDGDVIAAVTVSGPASLNRVRIWPATWSEDDQRFYQGASIFNAGLADPYACGSPCMINVLPDTRIKAVNTPWTPNPLVYRALAVMFHTNRGPIIQTYNIRPDITFAPVDPANLTWPSNRNDFDARPTNLTAPTSADFAAGTVPFDRGNLGTGPGTEVRLFIKDSGNQSTLVQSRYPGVYGDPMSTAPQATLNLLNSSGGSQSANAAFMLVADVDGDSAWHQHAHAGTTLRLGIGSRLGFNNVATPTVILQEPPRHADYVRVPANPSSSSVVNISRYSDFNAQFTHQTSSTRSFERQVEVSSSTSEKQSGSTSASLSIEVPAIAPAVSETSTVEYSESVTNLASTTGTEVLGGSTTFTVSDTYSTQAGDQLVFRNRDFDMWNYPVMGFRPYSDSKQNPFNDFPLDPYLRLGVPADDRITVVTGGTDAAAYPYQPEHIVGNILSYPYYSANSGQTRAEAIFTPRTNGFLRNGQSSMFPNTQYLQYSVGTTNSTHLVQFDSSSNSSDTYATSATTEETTDVTVTAEVEASGSFLSGLVGVSGSASSSGSYSTEASQSFSRMNTRTIESSVQNQFTLNVAPVSSSSRSYNFLPMMWFDKGGAMRLSHLVNLPTSGTSFWGTNYSTPDYALNLPRRIAGVDDDADLNTEADRAIMKGYEVRDDLYGAGYPVDGDTLDPLARNAVISAAEDGGTARDGQQLTLRTRVYNLARHEAQPVGSPVLVRFELQEVDKTNGAPVEVGSRTLIGETTVGPIAGQENRWAQILWDTSGAGACLPSDPVRTYRIYVIVDPANAITNETHELRDRDNNPLLDPNTSLPIDSYTYNGVTYTLEKGQNNLGWFPFNIVPNPSGVNNSPQATSNAQPRTRDVGGSVTFSASFTGTPPPTFRWRRNGVNLSDGPTSSGSVISGAFTNSLTITNIQLSSAGNYRCQAVNTCGNDLSPASTLTVNPPPCDEPVPSSQAQDLTRLVGQTAIFSATFTSATTLSYQWFHGGVALANGTAADGSVVSGATTGTLTITNVQFATAGTFECRGTNECGSDTSPASTLTVNSNCTTPETTSKAQPLTRNQGQAASFTATFTGSPAPSLRWRRNNVNLTDGTTENGSIISGSATGTLTITNLHPADAGNYKCRATNTCGSVNSPVSELTVNAGCPGDFNHDSFVTSQDFFDFLTAFFTLDPAADVNHSGSVNSQDFFDFLTAFFTPCP